MSILAAIQLGLPQSWLPDETLFSFCSRYHHVSGHRLAAQSCKALFGTHRAGSGHDIPAHVQTLVDRINGSLGTAREILLARTLLPFYFPFHQNHRCTNWLDQMSAGSSSTLKAQLGLAASQFGAAHPLKACPDCIREDAREHGVAYWHVAHQVPGVLVCPLHRSALLTATDKVSGQDRFGWVLPTQARMQTVIHTHQLGGGELLLAQASLALWKLPVSFTFAPDKLNSLYQAKLVACGYVRPHLVRVDHQAFEQSLAELLAATSTARYWPWLNAPENLPTFARRLLRMGHPASPRFSNHPLNHLVLMLLLFGSWEAFWAEYQAPASDTPETQAPLEQSMPLSAPAARDPKTRQRTLLLEHVSGGQSVSRSADLTGVSVATAMAWLSSEGIQSPRRPKILKAELRSSLITELKRGTDKRNAASLFGISVETVTRVLLTEPGLHNQWLASRFTQAQVRSRKAWSTAQQALPEASSNEWRKWATAAYAWLYRNDRLWLQRSIEERPAPTRPSLDRRDWEMRDIELAQAVRVAALDWHNKHGGRRPTIGDLCAEVVGLRQKMSVLYKLPLTRQTVHEACLRSKVTLPDSDCQIEGT